MRYLILAALTLLSPVVVKAQEFNSSCFYGLNDADSPATLPNCESQDLLNVESNLDGTAILKRKGYQLTASLTVTTAPVNGSHTFIDGSGNRVDIVCHDRYCAKSVNGNAFTNFLTTAGYTGNQLPPRRWSWVSVGGVAYGANDRRDPILKYDGTTASYPTTMPNASILALTEDRLLAGDITNQPNRVWYSSAGYYDGFTVGVNPYDSYFDDIGSAGDRIRGIRCISGNCFIFKSESVTLCQTADQYTTQCSVISPNIGTTDPSSIVSAGSELYFRAQDKNYWKLGGQGLEQISKKIPNLVKSQSGGLSGGEKSNTQTSQADWQAGVQYPTTTWDTASRTGSIFVSSYQFVDSVSSYTAFNLGSVSSFTFINLTASTDTLTGASWFLGSGGEATQSAWGFGVFAGNSQCGSNSTGDATWGGLKVKAIGGNCTGSTPVTQYIQVNNYLTGATIAISSYSYSATQGCTNRTIDVSAQTVPMIMYLGTVSGAAVSPIFYSTYMPSGLIRYAEGFQAPSNGFGTCVPGPSYRAYFDFPEPYYIASSTFISRAYNTQYSTPTWGTINSSFTTFGAGDVKFYTQTSNDASTWDSAIYVSTNSKPTSVQKRYVRYLAGFTTTMSTVSVRVSSVSIQYASTGTFRTQCIQPNSSISGWGTINCAQSTTGNASIVYYATSAATCAALPTTPPTDVSKWGSAITNNANVTIATNTAVYIGWRSLLTSATEQAQVDSCILNWNEGTLSQPAWAVFDSVKNAVYWTSTINSASAPNRLLKYDRNLEQWYPFDISAAAPNVINNSIYFGGTGAGTWNLFGSVDSDNGSSITGYWKTKDIGSSKPFVEKSFKTLSILSRNNGSGTMTGTWTLSNSRTGDYTIILSTGTGINYARSNFNLPIASPQQFINVKVGNTNTTPFEVLGLGVTWQELPWRVSNP